MLTMGLLMLDRIEFLAPRVLTVTFFIGLIGCAVVVVISWISVGRAAFSKDKPDDI